MKKVILFVILDEFADWEYAYLASFINDFSSYTNDFSSYTNDLGQEKYIVKTVSINKNNVKSIGGFTVVPDYDINSVPDVFEGLVLVGGKSWRNKDALKIKSLVDKAIDENKVVGAICDATVFLGAIGLLNDIEHTSNDLNALKQWCGKKYTGEDKYLMKQAVCDKNIITANGTAALEFAKEMLIALDIAPEKIVLEWYNVHKLGYYESAMPIM